MKKKFSKKPNAETYYYVVENRIKDGQPTPVHILYIGSIKKILQVYEFYKKHKKGA
jgi:hypothetical protein